MPAPLRAVDKPAPETAIERARRLNAESAMAANQIATELVQELHGMLARCDEVMSLEAVPAGVRNEIGHVRRELQARLDTIGAIGARG